MKYFFGNQVIVCDLGTQYSMKRVDYYCQPDWNNRPLHLFINCHESLSFKGHPGKEDAQKSIYQTGDKLEHPP